MRQLADKIAVKVQDVVHVWIHYGGCESSNEMQSYGVHGAGCGREGKHAFAAEATWSSYIQGSGFPAKCVPSWPACYEVVNRFAWSLSPNYTDFV
jgi:hypothetical protein